MNKTTKYIIGGVALLAVGYGVYKFLKPSKKDDVLMGKPEKPTTVNAGTSKPLTNQTLTANVSDLTWLTQALEQQKEQDKAVAQTNNATNIFLGMI